MKLFVLRLLPKFSISPWSICNPSVDIEGWELGFVVSSVKSLFVWFLLSSQNCLTSVVSRKGLTFFCPWVSRNPSRKKASNFSVSCPLTCTLAYCRETKLEMLVNKQNRIWKTVPRKLSLIPLLLWWFLFGSAFPLSDKLQEERSQEACYHRKGNRISSV